MYNKHKCFAWVICQYQYCLKLERVELWLIYVEVSSFVANKPKAQVIKGGRNNHNVRNHYDLNYWFSLLVNIYLRLRTKYGARATRRLS